MRFHHTATSVYLGYFRGHDLFFDCPAGLPTVVARYGHGAHDYRSGLYWADFDPILCRAKERAFEAGLVTADDIENSTDVDDEISSCPDCRKLEHNEEEDTICEFHMKELTEHYSCLYGEMTASEDCVCLH